MILDEDVDALGFASNKFEITGLRRMARGEVTYFNERKENTYLTRNHKLVLITTVKMFLFLSVHLNYLCVSGYYPRSRLRQVRCQRLQVPRRKMQNLIWNARK